MPESNSSHGHQFSRRNLELLRHAEEAWWPRCTWCWLLVRAVNARKKVSSFRVTPLHPSLVVEGLLPAAAAVAAAQKSQAC